MYFGYNQIKQNCWDLLLNISSEDHFIKHLITSCTHFVSFLFFIQIIYTKKCESSIRCDKWYNMSKPWPDVSKLCIGYADDSVWETNCHFQIQNTILRLFVIFIFINVKFLDLHLLLLELLHYAVLYISLLFCSFFFLYDCERKSETNSIEIFYFKGVNSICLLTLSSHTF